jgi:hypothetical protein
MSGSSILVTLNALRLRPIRPDRSRLRDGAPEAVLVHT